MQRQYMYISKDRNEDGKKETSCSGKGLSLFYDKGNDSRLSYSKWIDNDGKIYQKIPIANKGTYEYESKKALQYTTRCILESKYHNNNYFITLTYNEDNVPKTIKGKKTLKKEDVVKVRKAIFMKLKRANCEPMFATRGEYGSKTMRPHYHIIAMGYDDNDFKLVKNKTPLEYTSKYLNNLWKKGNIKIEDCNDSTISYVCGYCNKDKHFIQDEREQEFTVLSRKMGYKYLEENKQNLLNGNKIRIGYANKNMPSTFEKVLSKNEENVIKLDKIKENNLKTARIQELQTYNKLEHIQDADDKYTAIQTSKISRAKNKNTRYI